MPAPLTKEKDDHREGTVLEQEQLKAELFALLEERAAQEERLVALRERRDLLIRLIEEEKQKLSNKTAEPVTPSESIVLVDQQVELAVEKKNENSEPVIVVKAEEEKLNEVTEAIEKENEPIAPVSAAELKQNTKSSIDVDQPRPWESIDLSKYEKTAEVEAVPESADALVEEIIKQDLSTEERNEIDAGAKKAGMPMLAWVKKNIVDRMTPHVAKGVDLLDRSLENAMRKYLKKGVVITFMSLVPISTQNTDSSEEILEFNTQTTEQHIPVTDFVDPKIVLVEHKDSSSVAPKDIISFRTQMPKEYIVKPTPSDSASLEDIFDSSLDTAGIHIADTLLFGTLSDNCKRIYIFNAKKTNPEPYIIADKPNGCVYVFDSGNMLVATFPALFGKKSGESKNLVDPDNLKKSNRTTPMGSYHLAANGVPVEDSVEYHTNMLALQETIDPTYGYVGIHETWPEDLVRRTAALNSPTIADNKQSYGCINVSKENFETYIKPTFAIGTHILYVTPDDQKTKFVPKF